MNANSAQMISTPVVERKILITNPRGVAMEPLAIATTDDGGVIVAGKTRGRQAWAAKVDAKGNVLWSHYRDLEDVDRSVLAAEPEYRGIVPMPDGSAFLCGTLPREHRQDQVALITHLDSTGKLVREQVISAPDGGNFHVHGCIAWQGGILVKGATPGAVPPGAVPLGDVAAIAERIRLSSQSRHLLLALDSSGETRWTRILPFAAGVSASSTFQGTVLQPSGEKLFVSATDNKKTELLSIDRQGQVLVRKTLDGTFLLAPPIVPDDQLTAFGWFASFESPRVLLNFDSSLNEIHRVQGQDSHFSPSVALRLPDQSLALFGDNVHAPNGPSHQAGIVHVHKDLRTGSITFADEVGFLAPGNIFAAASVQGGSEFVFAVRAIRSEGTDSSTSGFSRGAVLKFVRLNPNK
jgi:hypothetical protein